jgi:hypothetical protein
LLRDIRLLGHFLAGTRRTSGFGAKYFRTVKNDREKDQPAPMGADWPSGPTGYK